MRIFKFFYRHLKEIYWAPQLRKTRSYTELMSWRSPSVRRWNSHFMHSRMTRVGKITLACILIRLGWQQHWRMVLASSYTQPTTRLICIVRDSSGLKITASGVRWILDGAWMKNGSIVTNTHFLLSGVPMPTTSKWKKDGYSGSFSCMEKRGTTTKESGWLKWNGTIVIITIISTARVCVIGEVIMLHLSLLMRFRCSQIGELIGVTSSTNE